MAMHQDLRRVDRRFTCGVCGSESLVTFVLRPQDPTPTVSVRHNLDGTHTPELSGNSPAARGRRSAPVYRETRTLDS